MKNDQVAIQKALSDIEFIRGIVEDKGLHDDDKTRKVSIVVHLAAILAAGTLLAVNLVEPGIIDLAFNVASTDNELRSFVFYSSVLALILAILFCYGSVWSESRRSEVGFNDFIKIKFRYLVFQNFFSDLLIKLLIFSVIIFSGHTALLPIVLGLFSIDYVLQGRLFHFSKPTQIGLGFLLFLILGGFYIFSNVSFSIALILFIVPSVLSGLNLLRQSKVKIG